MNKTVFNKFIFGIFSAFIVSTMIWVYWCFVTPGDYFANGSKAVNPSLIVGAVLGFAVGWFRTSKKIKWLVGVLLIAAIVYWLFVPDGWWAHEPSGF